MGAIYLIRHGQASFGKANYDVLSETGEEQARHLGDFLKTTGLTFDHVVAGDMKRQQDTAAIALQHAGLDPGVIATDSRFNEFAHEKLTQAHVAALTQTDEMVRDFVAGKLERKKHFQKVFELVVARWTSGEYPVEGEETWVDFTARVNLGLDHWITQAGRSSSVAVFTSGGPITAALKRIMNLAAHPAFELNWQIVNGSITRLQYSPERLSLSYFNDHTYLRLRDANLVTYR